MTKNKSRKMTKSTFAIIIMAIAMVAMLAFGGTYAYFTATATENSATITTGSVKLTASDIGTSSNYTLTAENVVPGDVISNKPITLTTESKGTDVYIAIRVVLTNDNGTLAGNALANVSTWLNATPYSGATWLSTDTANVYVLGADSNATAVPTAQTVKITADQIKFEADADWEQGSAKPALMEATLTITFEARALQSKNSVTTANDVASELFGA